MGWQARLELDVQRREGRSVAAFRHEGPLRILQTLYPEGDAIAHHVLVHPPGGLVGGDRLDVEVSVGPGAHGVVTTPGASRFYRSEGEDAVQHTRLSLADGARFEWLPMETIYYSGCRAENRLDMQLGAGAEVIGWDVAALGLPASGRAFEAGCVLQHLSLGQDWLERGRIEAGDHRLLDGPLGLAGHRCLATLWWAAGQPLEAHRRDAALESLRETMAGHALAATSGATCPCDQVLVVRVLAGQVEPAMELLRQLRGQLRGVAWGLPPTPSRLWAL